MNTGRKKRGQDEDSLPKAATLACIECSLCTSCIPGHACCAQEEEEEERQREADKQRLNLPDLVAATRRSLPSLKSTLLKDGRSAFIEVGDG